MNDVFSVLKSRWRPEFDALGTAAAARPHFHRALDVAASIKSKRAELEKDTDLSPAGRAKKLREYAAEEAGRVAKAKRALATAHDNLKAQQRALVPGVKDKSDVAAAMRRQEIRAELNEKTMADLHRIFGDAETPLEVLSAVFEWPMPLRPMAGLSTEERARVMGDLTDAVVNRLHGPQVAALKVEGEALELLGAAIRVASTELANAADVQHGALDAWLAEVAPVDPKEAAAEAERFHADAVTKAATALPTAARMSLVDSLLAINTDELAGKPRSVAA